MKWIWAPLTAVLLILLSAAQAGAFSATSTNFFNRASVQFVSGGSTTSPMSTSTNFKHNGGDGLVGAGIGTSTNFKNYSGFLQTLDKSPSPIYEVKHYHWRNDDGSESGATSATGGVEDTVLQANPGSNYRLRFGVSNSGGSQINFLGPLPIVEFDTKLFGSCTTTNANSGGWASIALAAGNIDEVNSTNVAQGDDVTNIAVGTGGVSDGNTYFVSNNNGVIDGTDTAGATAVVPSHSFLEYEVSIKIDSSLTDGEQYCLRLASGQGEVFENTAVAELEVSASSLTFVVDSASQTFPVVTPGTVAATTSRLYVRTTDPGGFNVTVQRNDGDTTLDLTTNAAINITDKTAWAPGIATTSAGNATASTTQPETLQFRVRSTGTDVPNYASAWWGTDDSTTNARFAGFPSSAQQIANRSVAAAATTTTTVLYNLNVPVTQVTGTYDGGITYIVTANP